MSFARDADVSCPRIFKRLQVMKPSPLGENKFGDGDSCGMHGLRFSAPPDGDGHLPNGHPEASVTLQLFFLAGSHPFPTWQRCNRLVTNPTHLP